MFAIAAMASIGEIDPLADMRVGSKVVVGLSVVGCQALAMCYMSLKLMPN